nr:hypothetical protein [Tanacetum cinerariifolium]
EEAQVPAQGDDVQEPAAEEVATNVVPPTPTSPSPSSPVIPSSPPYQSPCLENDKAAQQLEIVKLNARVKKLEKINKVKSSKLRQLKKVGTSQRIESSDDVENVFNQGRNIVDMDQDEGIEIVVDHEKDAKVEGRHADKQAEIYNIDLDHSSKVLSMQDDDTEVKEAVEVGRIVVDMDQDEGIKLVTDQEKDAEVEGRHIDKQAKIYNIDLDHSSKVLSMQDDDTEVKEAVEVVTTAKLMTKLRLPK